MFSASMTSIYPPKLKSEREKPMFERACTLQQFAISQDSKRHSHSRIICARLYFALVNRSFESARSNFLLFITAINLMNIEERSHFIL